MVMSPVSGLKSFVVSAAASPKRMPVVSMSVMTRLVLVSVMVACAMRRRACRSSR